jgi:hypothetical protein
MSSATAEPTTEREFQGTIASQMRVNAADQYEAHEKLSNLRRFMAENGIVVDQWTVPLIRDMAGEDRRSDHYTVLTAIEVESSGRGTAECAGTEVVTRSVEGMTDPKAGEITDLKQGIEYEERRRDERQRTIDRYNDRLNKLLEERGNLMSQGVVTGYRVLGVLNGGVENVTLPSSPAQEVASQN